MLYQQRTQLLKIDEEVAFSALEKDFIHCNEKGTLGNLLNTHNKQTKKGNRNKRQKQHA